MPQTTLSLPGEAIDQVCRRAYGDESGYLEAVLAANPGLALQPPRLPADVSIVLPDIAAPAPADRVVKLWD